MVDLTKELLAKFNSISGKSNARAATKNVKGTISCDVLISTYLTQRGCCYYCAKLMSIEKISVEHIKPMSNGGLNKANNISLACVGCNNARNLIYTKILQRKHAIQQEINIKQKNITTEHVAINEIRKKIVNEQQRISLLKKEIADLAL